MRGIRNELNVDRQLIDPCWRLLRWRVTAEQLRFYRVIKRRKAYKERASDL